MHIAVISGPESHLKVASDPSITLVKSTNPLLGLGGTPQVAEGGYIYSLSFIVDISCIAHRPWPGSLHPASAGSGVHSPFSIHTAIITPSGMSPVSHW